MKSIYIFLICLLVINPVSAQLIIKGVIKDADTKNNISQVTVSTSDSHYTTISNDNGAFRLICPDNSKEITLSSIGYKTSNIKTDKLPADGLYYLKFEPTNLDEVVIVNRPMSEFIDNLINNSINSLTSPMVLNSYYREFVKINEKNTKFSDGIIDYSLLTKNGKVKTDLIVKQSRAVELDSVKEGFVRGVGPDVRKAVNVHCSFIWLMQIFSNKKEYAKYIFTITSQDNGNEKPLQVIQFKPKESIEEALFEGTIEFDPEKNIILAYETKIAPAYSQYKRNHNIILARYAYEDVTVKTVFSDTDNNYNLSYGYISGIIRIWNKNYDNSYKFTSDIVITGVSDNYDSFKTKDKYKERSLYERGSNYTDKFWLSNNSIVLTDEEEQIIQTLQNK